MATGEDTDHEELGGAEMQLGGSRGSRTTLRPRRARRDPDRPRESSRHLNWKKAARSGGPETTIEPPRYYPEELLGIASPDVKGPVRSARGPSRASWMGSRFSEFKARCYGQNPGVRLGPTLHGTPDRHPSEQRESCSPRARRRAPSSSSCATRAISRWCSCRTSPAFMVGPEVRAGGPSSSTARKAHQRGVETRTVPAITIMDRRELRRPATTRWCGPGLRAQVSCSPWPNHRIAVMGGKQPRRRARQSSQRETPPPKRGEGGRRAEARAS